MINCIIVGLGGFLGAVAAVFAAQWIFGRQKCF